MSLCLRPSKICRPEGLSIGGFEMRGIDDWKRWADSPAWGNRVFSYDAGDKLVSRAPVPHGPWILKKITKGGLAIIKNTHETRRVAPRLLLTFVPETPEELLFLGSLPVYGIWTGTGWIMNDNTIAVFVTEGDRAVALKQIAFLESMAAKDGGEVGRQLVRINGWGHPDLTLA